MTVMTSPLESLADAVRTRWRGRYIVLTEVLGRPSDMLVEELRDAGGTVLGVLAGSGVPNNARTCLAGRGTKAPTRAEFAALLRNLHTDVGEWVDRVDPDGDAEFVGTNFLELSQVAGRDVIGGRRARWGALEDKTVIDALFRRANVPVPPSVVHASDARSIAQSVRELASSSGTILAIDSSTDFRGDAEGIRWIRRGVAPSAETLAWARTQGQRVRVSSFVTGTPCSVLGVVTSAGVGVFDPFEIVTLRVQDSERLVFAGSSTNWRPLPDAVDEIRGAARRVGRELRADVDYRGFFSLDGVLGGDGFVATEVNPRLASGLGLRAARPDFPLYLFARSLQSPGDRLGDLPVEEIETQIRRLVSENPSHSVVLPRTLDRHPTPLEAVCADPGAAADGMTDSGIRFRVVPAGVEVLAPVPTSGFGTVGSAVAQLGRDLGWSGLESAEVVR